MAGQSNPLVARGAQVAGFQQTVAHSRGRDGARIVAGGSSLTLSSRGRELVAELVLASPAKVARIEAVLHETEGDIRTPTVEPVTPEEAAALLGVSRPTVVRWASEGLLVDHMVGTHHRFDRADVLVLRQKRLDHAAQNRAAAQAARQIAAALYDYDAAPTPDELVQAGLAARSGNRSAAQPVLARARRAGARGAAERASAPA